MPYVQTLTIEVRVDMMLVIALAVPGHHIPPILSLGGLAARCTSSSAHRLVTVRVTPTSRDSLVCF